MGNIQTGVDRLVALVKEKEKISIDEAAKTLGVSKINIQEWADFLEEEGIIEIKYGFAKTYLVRRKLTSSETVLQERHIEQQRETFLTTVDPSIHVPPAGATQLRAREPESIREPANLDGFKKEFQLLKSDLLLSVAALHTEIRALHAAEREQARAVVALTKERTALRHPVREQPQARLQIDDVYWLAQHSLNAILATAGHRPEDRLDRAVAMFTHEFLSNSPDLADRWKALLHDLIRAKRRSTPLDAAALHDLFTRCRNLMSDTLHSAVEPVDDFTRKVNEIETLLRARDFVRAEEHYRVLVTTYEALSDERKAVHYERFDLIYRALNAARAAGQMNSRV